VIETKNSKVYFGNNLEVLPTLEDNSVDSIVTDPPYELGFMGKSWDSSGIAYSTELWSECLRVLKPGGHLLSFSGSRTYHRMVVAIEDSGFEIRDMISWISNKTFPKSHNLKGEWEGWGTGLKPTVEPIVMARKPLGGTVAWNVEKYGTGALNIKESRIGTEVRSYQGGSKLMEERPWTKEQTEKPTFEATGRWPANVIFDEEAAKLIDKQSGTSKSGKPSIRTTDGFNRNAYGSGMGIKAGQPNGEYGDAGGASRFFYVARASKADRNEGVEKSNNHPTVKPTDLMRYLVKLVTPPNGIVLDPFTGSGSTGKAAILEGFQFIGIELTEDYWPIIKGRLEHAETQLTENKEKEGEQLF
jgi:DNA modification methylase